MSDAATLVDHLRHRGIADERVLSAIRLVDRERFVPPERLDQAWDDMNRVHGAIGDSWFGNVGYDHLLPPFSGGCVAGSGILTARSVASAHPGGFHTGLADGSVRFTSRDLDRAVWRALGTRNGGEAVAAF